MAKLSAKEKEFFGPEVLEIVNDLPAVSGENETLTEEPEHEVAQPELVEPHVEEDTSSPEPKVVEAEERPQQQKMVPIAALHEEREARKKLDATVTALQKKMEEYEAKSQPKVEQPQPIDPDIDPVGALKETRQKLNQWEQDRAQERYQRDIMQAISQKEAEYTKQVPDYNDAVHYFKMNRDMELQELGYPPMDRQLIMRNEAFQMIENSLQSGRDPADLLYKMAKTRGYRPATSESESTDSEERLETIQRGQKASRSLAGSSSSAKMPLNAQSLLKMSAEEIGEIDMKDIRKLMGE